MINFTKGDTSDVTMMTKLSDTPFKCPLVGFQ